MTTYLTYIDDSGDEDHDILAALCIPVETWGPVVNFWKVFRRTMKKQWGIPPSVEFHSQELLHRSASTLFDHVDRDGDEPRAYPYPRAVTLPGGMVVTREDLFVAGVTRLAEMNTGTREFGVRLVVAHAPVANGQAFLHEPLMGLLQDFLVAEDSWAVLWVDGIDPHREDRLRAHHRALPAGSRRILEDAMPRRSTHSHLIQMADVCAHAALREIRAAQSIETRKRLGTAFRRLDGLLVHPDRVAPTGYWGMHEIEPKNE